EAAQDVTRAADALAKVEQNTKAAEDTPEVSAKHVAALEEIQEQLRTGKISADEARRSSAGVLEEAASKLDAQARKEQLAADALRDRLNTLRDVKPDRTPEQESEFARAMRSGDLRAAREAAEKL